MLLKKQILSRERRVIDVLKNETECIPPVVEEEATGFQFTWVNMIKLGASVVLVCLSGIFSGLTLGLLGLDKTTLDVRCISFTNVLFECINIIWCIDY
jgi:hypothetical protein